MGIAEDKTYKRNGISGMKEHASEIGAVISISTVQNKGTEIRVQKKCNMIKVVVYEDNNSLRQTLQLLIAQDDSLWLIGAHSNCNNIKFDIEDGIKPDVIMMDILRMMR